MDAAVRAQLARSLEAVYARARSFVTYDETALQPLLNDIDRGPIRPAVFGTYTDLVESICSDDANSAQQLSDRLLGIQASCADTRIVTLADRDLGPDQAQRYVRLIDDDPEERIYMQPAAKTASAASIINEALSLIEAGSPALAEEIRALTREIVVVEPAMSPETGQLSQFDGASTFYLWGSVFVRVAGKSRIELAQTLAHETGHLLLFGLMMGRPLVENAYGERYNSPLRQDPRPMEGLVHAAYVLARMHYCLASLISSGLLTPKERANALSAIDHHHRRFCVALDTIQQGAQFTPKGAPIFESASEYMARLI